MLFACLRHDFDDGARAALAAHARAELPWGEVLRIAVRHQVAPLVLHALGKAGVLGVVPEVVRAHLHREMLGNLSAKAAQRAALVEAARELAGEGLDVMPIKGTSLDLRLPDSALTVSGDVDLLVRQDWGEASPRAHARVSALNAGKPVVDVDFARHPDLVLNGVLPVDFAAIWRDARPTTIDGVAMHRMSATHDFVCACINSVRKRCFRLKSLYEIAELLRGDHGIDPATAATTARAWRCAGIVWVAVRASAAAAGAPLPAVLLDGLGLGVARARALDALVARMSFTRLAALHGGIALGGKRIGRGLLLPYASLGLGAALRAGVIAFRQAVRARATS